jgi:hypothetical protein
LNPAARKARATLAAIERHNGPADPRIPQLRADLAVEQLADRISDAIRSDPPPTPAQRERLARILVPGASG